MMKNFKDTENFEDTMLDMERSAKKPVVHQSPKQKEDAFYREFLTDKVETLIGKMLLDIKMEYFKEGKGLLYPSKNEMVKILFLKQHLKGKT